MEASGFASARGGLRSGLPATTSCDDDQLRRSKNLGWRERASAGLRPPGARCAAAQVVSRGGGLRRRGGGGRARGGRSRAPAAMAPCALQAAPLRRPRPAADVAPLAALPRLTGGYCRAPGREQHGMRSNRRRRTLSQAKGVAAAATLEPSAPARPAGLAGTGAAPAHGAALRPPPLRPSHTLSGATTTTRTPPLPVSSSSSLPSPPLPGKDELLRRKLTQL